MKTFLRQYSKPAVSILLALVLMATTLVTGVIAAGGYKATVNDNNTEATAISSSESKTTSVEAETDNSADTAVKNTASSAVNKKKDKKQTGANAKKLTGYSGTAYVKGQWDSWATPDNNKGHNISTSSGYTVSLPANTIYEFCFATADNNDIFKKDQTISGSVTYYDFSNNATANAKLKTTVAGNYNFKFHEYTNDGIRVNITYPASTTTTTWTAVGAYGSSSSADAGFFGTAWAPTATTNDMTKSGTTWSKTWNNVTLSTQKTVYYKVAKNHSWDTAYPSSNETKTIPAGTYNITITYNETGNAVDLTATPVVKSTLSVKNNISNAEVTATYNGTTVGEGSSISNVPQGAKVTVNVTPAQGKKCTAVTGTYNTSSTTSATSDNTGKVWTLTMPGANTEVDVTMTNVTLKKIYFNNSYTLYGSVYAYVYDKDDGSTKTYEYLGPRPGTTMTKLDNSNIWYIEVPDDVDYVEFISGDGSTTGEMSIPNTTYPKYTAPYGHNDAPTTDNGGTWGTYLYGSNNKRTNEYTVSDGTTMNGSNLFTGLTATLYDYYTDNEITNSAGSASDTGNSGWIKGIASNEYCWTDNGWKWNPYTMLNSALSTYANNTNQPKYDITYPLYFGNLNVTSKDSSGNNYAIDTTGRGSRSDVMAYHNWNSKVNNSIDLNSPNNAVTCLTGKTLAGSTIHHYNASDTTNENGAPMAMFDEDFLSGENNQSKALATILRTSSFPVRKANVTVLKKLYLDTNGKWLNGSADLNTYKYFAHYYTSANNDMYIDVAFTHSSGNNFNVSIPHGYDKVVIVAMPSNATSVNWNNKIAQTDDLYVPTTKANSKFTVSGDAYTDTKKLNGSWGNNDSADTGTHEYYEYDSTGGKDNAYITDINKSDKTAKINYYNNTNKVHSKDNIDGFFPFNRNNLLDSDYAQDLGFGMKLTIPFTLNGSGNSNGVNTDGTDQTFDFSGDDDLWVFVDNKLVLDLGGAHARTTGFINFHTKTVTANNVQSVGSGSRNGSFADGFNTNENYVHTMTIYYMERGMFDSNLKFGFSFHAIPNQFWIDKKIRTKDIINAGFYVDNQQTGSASNKNAAMTASEGRFISNFEASYQNESFTVTHKYGSTASGATTAASGKKYTIDNDTQTYSTGDSGTYPIKHDLGNAFIGQFTKGQYFNLTETYGNNKYVYDPLCTAWDQANNNEALTVNGDNINGYTFRFNPTTNVQTAIENTNIKARFENFMKAHTLTLTKELTNTTDTSTDFTFQVLFNFDYTDGSNTYDQYIAYPLYCDVDGERTQLSNTGTITVKAGQVVEIEEIPENAKIKVVEVLTDTVSGYRYDGITIKNGSTDITNDATKVEKITKGAEFTMGNDNAYVNISNKKPDNKYTITYVYPSYGESPKTNSLYGNQSYTVSGVFTESELDTYLMLDANNNLAFRNDTLKKSFVSIKAPYEDNFMQKLSFADATINETGTGWDSNGDYSCSLTATGTADYTINARFDLPYDVDSNMDPQESGTTSKVAYTTKTQCGEKDITCFDWYVTSGKKNSGDTTTNDEPVYVKAPLIVYENVNDETTKMYFQYWSVKTQNSYGVKSQEYTRCYDYEFNLSLFMDCIIEPVYATTWAQTSGNPNPPRTYNNYVRFDPELQILGDPKGISIAFLENSRNQYNNGGKGGKTNGDDAADTIFSDFLLSFNKVDELTQLNQLQEDTKKAGIVIESVGNLGSNNSGGFDTNKDYSKDNNYTNSETTSKNSIIAWLEGRANKPSKVQNKQFDVTELDNKNCIQYFVSFKNRNLGTNSILLNTNQNRYRVFRAYSYIGGVSGNSLTSVTLSEPVYFTIYDIGSNGLADNFAQ